MVSQWHTSSAIRTSSRIAGRFIVFSQVNLFIIFILYIATYFIFFLLSPILETHRTIFYFWIHSISKRPKYTALRTVPLFDLHLFCCAEEQGEYIELRFICGIWWTKPLQLYYFIIRICVSFLASLFRHYFCTFFHPIDNIWLRVFGSTSFLLLVDRRHLYNKIKSPPNTCSSRWKIFTFFLFHCVAIRILYIYIYEWASI